MHRYTLLALFLTATAIQVTPNSPCASLCIDTSRLDASDPGASSTTNADIVCTDADFNGTATGQAWSACMACLQTSTYYSKGDDDDDAADNDNAESDQAWFFYNLRYNVDYCVLAGLNATGIGSSPCQTSTACGPLQHALSDDLPGTGTQKVSDSYTYCSVDNGAMTGTAVTPCINCVASGGGSTVLANALVALEAGCQQQLAPGEAVGLSGSIFATGTTVSIVSPTASSTSSTSSAGSSRRPKTTTIIVIAIVAVLAVVAVAAFSYVCYRKRRGRSSKHFAAAAAAANNDKQRLPNTSIMFGGHATTKGSIGPAPWMADPGHHPHKISMPSSVVSASNASIRSGKSISSIDSAHDRAVQQQQQQHQQHQNQQAAVAAARLTQMQASAAIAVASQSQQEQEHQSAAPLRLSVIAESPLPSPAFQAGGSKPPINAQSIAEMTAPTTTTTPMTTTGNGSRQLPRLKQLNTSFAPPPQGNFTRRQSPLSLSTANTNTPLSGPSPSSATALLAYANLPPPPAYNPADYGPPPPMLHGVSPVSVRSSRGMAPSPASARGSAGPRGSAYPGWPAGQQQQQQSHYNHQQRPTSLGLGQATMAARPSASPDSYSPPPDGVIELPATTTPTERARSRSRGPPPSSSSTTTTTTTTSPSDGRREHRRQSSRDSLTGIVNGLPGNPSPHARHAKEGVWTQSPVRWV